MIKRQKAYGGLAAVVLMVALAAGACSSGGSAPKVITRDVEFSEEYSGWGSREYYTGIALQEEEGEPAVGNYIYVEVSIPMPGRYYPWILAAVDRYDTTAEKTLRITVTPVKAHSQSRMDSVEIDLQPTRALEWMPTRGEKRWLEFPDFGSYFLVLEGAGDEDVRMIIDKLLLTDHPRYAPTGYAVIPDTVDVVLPPAWAFGVLYGGFTDQQETLQRIDSIIDADLPIDGYWVDSWFWDYRGRGAGPEGYVDFKGDPAAYPDPGAMWEAMADRNVKAGLWIWDAIQQPGNEQVFREFETWGFFTGPPYINTSSLHNAGEETMIADIDFENPEAVNYWKLQMEPLFEQGLDFLRLDRSASVYFLQAAFEATQELGEATRGRGFILSRLPSTYDPLMKRYPAKWAGDAKIAWTQPGYPDLEQGAMGGLRENVAMVANPRASTYEAPFLTHDAGGYGFFGTGELSDSLYMRWIQFSMFNPITTVFTAPENPTANLPFRFSERAVENFRFYGQLKLCLFPYIYTYAHLTRQTRRKMIQGMAAYPDQYLFGRELLVAPVVERGAGERAVYLPPGEWIDFYDHTVYEGDRLITYRAPLERLPLLVRAGSILPLRPYARSVERGSNDTLTLRLYPGSVEEGFFTLWEDDGTSSDYLEGRIATTTITFEGRRGGIELTIDAVKGEYLGMTAGRFYEVELRREAPPGRITVDGDALPAGAWSYDPESGWLRVQAGGLDRSRAHRVRIE